MPVQVHHRPRVGHRSGKSVKSLSQPVSHSLFSLHTFNIWNFYSSLRGEGGEREKRERKVRIKSEKILMRTSRSNYSVIRVLPFSCTCSRVGHSLANFLLTDWSMWFTTQLASVRVPVDERRKERRRSRRRKKTSRGKKNDQDPVVSLLFFFNRKGRKRRKRDIHSGCKLLQQKMLKPKVRTTYTWTSRKGLLTESFISHYSQLKLLQWVT